MVPSRGVGGSEARALLGPYRVTGTLGRGGMGVVYRAEHVETGALVAVKTLFSESARVLASLRREIHALARLDHPGVVRTVGHGVAAGVPWYAMELLVGRTFRDELALAGKGADVRPDGATVTATQAAVLRPMTGDATLARVRRSPMPPAARLRLLEIVHRTCEGLSYLHSKGVVHRDLKPENIFVRDSGAPVLVDLGIAASFGGARGREELTIANDVLGTAAYMAPEQIRGELVDARTDLYALGCVLYECLTGEPPFASAADHLTHSPLRPSLLADDVPEGLDRLAMALLEKRPRDRVGYADDVAAALAPFLGRGQDPGARAPAGRPYVYRPPFVGRESVAGELRAAVQQIGVRGGLIFVGGESGVGKTRLVMETVHEAPWQRVTTVLAQCGALGVGKGAASSDPPLHAFAPALLALADHCRKAGVAEARHLLGPFAKTLAPYQPALVDVPGYASFPEPPASDPREARAHVLNALRGALDAFAEADPLLLVIDDLQWADELTLSFLRTPARAERLLIIATYRADEASDELRETVRSPGARQLHLGRFDRAAVSEMVQGMLALDAPAPALEALLHEKCSGNAFFVVAYLQAAVAEGILTRRDGRWQLGAPASPDAYALAMPTELSELLDLRLRSLGATTCGLVQAGAVLGRDLDAEILFACAGLTGRDALDALQALRERNIFEETGLEGGGRGDLRFVHDKIREVTYARLGVAERTALHRKAGLVLEERGYGRKETCQIVAQHFSRGGSAGKAAAYFDRAGDYASMAYANVQAIGCYRSAIQELGVAEAGAEAPSPASVREKLSDLLVATGEPALARDVLVEALAGARDVDPLMPGRLHRKIGKTWEIQHRHEDAIVSYLTGAELLEGALATKSPAWWQEALQVRIDRLWVHYWEGQVEAMERLLAETQPLVDAHGAPFQRARFLQLKAMRNVRRERFLVSDETVAFARSALDSARGMREAERAALRFGLFFTLVLRGSLEEARREGEAVLGWADRAAATTLRVRTLTYLAVVARRRGDLQDVARLVDACRSICERPGEGAIGGVAGYYPGALLGNLSWLAWREGRAADAVKHGDAALASWGAERDPYPLQWLARFPLLAAALAERRASAVRSHARALLDERQQKLEAPLTEGLEALATTGSSVHAAAFVQRAQELRYL